MYIIQLGIIILNTIFKISSKNETAQNVLDGIQSILQLDNSKSPILDVRAQKRQLETITDQISESCKSLLDHYALTLERQDIFFDHAIQAIQHSDLSYELLFEKKLSVEEIYRLVIENAVDSRQEFEGNEWDIFDRLIYHIVSIIIGAAHECPDFTNQSLSFLLKRLPSINEKIEDVLAQVEEIHSLVQTKSTDFQKFESTYRNNIIEQYGWISLLGANSLKREERNYKLSIAYVSMEISQGKLTGTNVDLCELLKNPHPIWVSGEAGSGKTTFLQWIAIKAASNDVSEFPALKDTIPILIKLRSQNGTPLSLKHAINGVMRNSGYDMPEGWLSQQIEASHVIVLIDGVDEIKSSERRTVFNEIEVLHRQHPRLKLIITSRPQIDDRPSIPLFEVRILPMSRAKISTFLDYWHQAVLVDRLNLEDTEAKRYQNKLESQIDDLDSIRQIATNPLLCAMICALHFRNDSILSNKRNTLYEDCCKMLFDNRDIERAIPSFSHIDLSYDEKKIILSQLAYWMMKNGIVVAEEAQVLSSIQRSIAALRDVDNSPSCSEIFSYLIERSGILRTPENGKIDFIHKSFQDYLAAYEISRQDDWGVIASKADDISWYETLILSIGFASEKNTELVIQRILSQTEDKYTIIAAACGANS